MRARASSVGFTLVETALALLVASMALLAVASLLPWSMKTGRDAANDTRVAMFAEEAVSAILAMAEVRAWDSLENDIPQVDAPCYIFLDSNEISLEPDNQLHVNRYIHLAGSGGGGIPEYSLRYKLDVDDHPDHPDHVKYVRIEVWGGEFGPTDPEDAHVFYTEIYKTGN